jgi:hypothetical protein
MSINSDSQGFSHEEDNLTSSKPQKFKCRTCGKNDSQTKFYSYLYSKCILCKRKDVKDDYFSKKTEIREEKINQIDPDEKIRFLWSEMMREPIFKGKFSIMDFFEDTDQNISELVIRSMDNKNLLLEKIDNLKSYLNLSISTLKKELKEEIKKELIEEIKKDLIKNN